MCGKTVSEFSLVLRLAEPKIPFVTMLLLVLLLLSPTIIHSQEATIPTCAEVLADNNNGIFPDVQPKCHETTTKTIVKAHTWTTFPIFSKVHVEYQATTGTGVVQFRLLGVLGVTLTNQLERPANSTSVSDFNSVSCTIKLAGLIDCGDCENPSGICGMVVAG